jgi:lipoprotein-anchoring transpeptidase ErfK/SrfK
MSFMPKFDRLVLVFLAVFLSLGAVVLGKFSFFPQLSSSEKPSVYTGVQQPIDVASLTGEFQPDEVTGSFEGSQVASSEIVHDAGYAQVLGTTDASKRIEVDLTNQRVYAYEGDKKVFDFLVSTGKWGRTPTGVFKIWGKFRYAKMEGGKKELNTYYYLPNVPFVMFFSNDEIAASRGFSIHGTYWHSNFGTPMSHGCINMKTEEVEQLYYWAHPDLGDKKSGRATEEDQGTEVIIYGVAPKT